MKPDKTKTTFMCPICKEEVEVGAWGKKSESWGGYEYRLHNKRFHMKQHKEEKRKLLRTAHRMGGGSSFEREQCQDTKTGQNPSPSII